MASMILVLYECWIVRCPVALVSSLWPGSIIVRFEYIAVLPPFR